MNDLKTLCSKCGHPAHGRSCGYYNLAMSQPRERDCSCEANEKPRKTRKEESAPASETDEVGRLIENVATHRIHWNRGRHKVAIYVTPADRDMIVMALRVLRVLEHPDCIVVQRTGNGSFRIGIPDTSYRLAVTYETLDEAERILGMAKEGE